MQIPTSIPNLLTIAETISAPDRFFYSSFPEFTPLEFEHFCAFLLQKSGHIILELNTKQEADGGIDIITRKDGQIWITQVKKSDWNDNNKTGSKKKTKDYISLETLDRHFGVLSRKEDELKQKYGQEYEVIGYFMTLRRFSNPTLSHFVNNKKMKFCDLKELKRLIVESGILEKDLGIVVWQDLELAKIKEEISILEKLIAEKEVEHQTLQNKISSVEKLVMLELLDLYRLLDLLQNELKFIQDKKLTEQKNENLEEEFVQNQEKIEEDYEKLEEEYITKEIKVLEENEEKEFKQVYRGLMHRFHPDKNPQHKENYEKITKAITSAKEKQDLKMLKDIENFPEKYFGGVLPEQQDDKAVLAKFVVQLQTKIAELEDEIDSLQGQEGFKLYELQANNQDGFEGILAEKRASLEARIDKIREEIGRYKVAV